jgi:hypothetical protein
VVLSGAEGDNKKLASDPNALSFLMDAIRRCKTVGFSGIPSLTKKAGLVKQPGIVDLARNGGIQEFVLAGRQGRFWEREVD